MIGPIVPDDKRPEENRNKLTRRVYLPRWAGGITAVAVLVVSMKPSYAGVVVTPY
jgi:hypothetical protein